MERETCPHKNLYMNVCRNIVYNIPKVEITQMAINGLINKIPHIHPMGYYLAIKRNEILIHATIGMKLKNIS